MIILGTNSIKDTGYDVANSLRFNSGSSDFLGANQFGNTAFDSTKKFTLSVWVKKTSNGVNNSIFGAESDVGSDGKTTQFYFDTSDQLRFFDNFNNVSDVKTNRVFRDNSAFYNIILAVDYTQSTNSNRVKIIVNGEQETSLATSTYANQNDNITALQQNRGIILGVNENTGGTKYGYFNGYMSEFVFLDGIAADQTSFGEFDEDSPTIWKPKDVSGLTFGTNGFYLDFEDSSALGNDVSGNDNDFTVNNLTAIDQSTDTCTNNFSTMNPLDVPASNQPTFSEGNLKVVSPSASGDNNFGGASTFAVSSGKWYIEAKATVGAGGYSRNRIGITGNESTARLNNTLGANSYEYFYDSEAGNSNAGSYGNSYTTGDIIGIALNLDDNELKFYKNGTVQNSGTAISIDAPSTTSVGGYKIPQSDSSGVSGATSTFEFNFGSPAYAISSGNADGNGYGNFEYAVPSGHFAINSKNLAEYG